ncbi:MAG: FAD-binding oxidoreductase [Hyphomicrobiaceae bacterium]
MDNVQNRGTVVVIGAGIVGVSTAIWLQRAGHHVTLVDRLEPGEGTSYGNAGVLASSGVVPVTTPGLVGKAPGMLLDPMSPLFLRWSYLPRLAPWLVRYLSHCTVEHTRRITGLIHGIVAGSLDEHQALAEGTPAKRWIAPSDYVYVYQDRATFEADAFTWELRRDHGVVWSELQGAALTAYEPALGPACGFAAACHGNGHIKDPGRYVKDLARHAIDRGANFIKARATDFVKDGGKVTAVITDAGAIPCRAAVIATGAWSKALTARAGTTVPLETERGYHIELYDTNIMPRAPLMIAAGKFVATPMDGRLRLAGIVEFGGLAAPPSEAPYRLLLARAREALPGLTWQREERWMGHRPAPSDSVPVIGELPDTKGVFAGFGHHHIGLTGGPRTGRLLADMIVGRRPNVDIANYGPVRFK